MQTTLTLILKRMKNYDERMWATDKIPENKLAYEYEIIHHIDELREAHNAFLTRWMITIHEVSNKSIAFTCVQKQQHIAIHLQLLIDY
jgi:hypothetical protein